MNTTTENFILLATVLCKADPMLTWADAVESALRSLYPERFV